MFQANVFCFVLSMLETPLTSYRIGFGPPEKNRKNIGFGLPQKIGKNSPKKWPRNPILEPFFLFFGHFFSIFWGRPKPIFFLFFPISGRRPETYSVAGQRGLNSMPSLAPSPFTPSRQAKRFNRTIARTGVWRGILSSPSHPENCSYRAPIFNLLESDKK